MLLHRSYCDFLSLQQFMFSAMDKVIHLHWHLTHTPMLRPSPLENNYSTEADPVRLRQIKNLIYRFAVRFSGSGVDTVYCNEAIGYPAPVFYHNKPNGDKTPSSSP